MDLVQGLVIGLELKTVEPQNPTVVDGGASILLIMSFVGIDFLAATARARGNHANIKVIQLPLL